MKRQSSGGSVTPPTSLEAPISPPLRRIQVRGPQRVAQGKPGQSKESDETQSEAKSNIAAIEAGVIEIRDHLGYFSEHLREAAITSPAPPLSIPDFVSLYQRNQNSDGHHFVVHQHDHPIAGSILADQSIEFKLER